MLRQRSFSLQNFQRSEGCRPYCLLFGYGITGFLVGERLYRVIPSHSMSVCNSCKVRFCNVGCPFGIWVPRFSEQSKCICATNKLLFPSPPRCIQCVFCCNYFSVTIAKRSVFSKRGWKRSETASGLLY